MDLKNLITIIIPCKNEEQYIGKLLQDLQCQEQINGVRIIICDLSTDSTREVISLNTGTLQVEVMAGGPVAQARNTGALAATTPFLLFLDSDVRFFRSDTIKVAMEVLIKRKLLLVSAYLKNYGKDLRASILFKLFNLFNYCYQHFTAFAVGAFFLVDRKSFLDRGMFPTQYEHSEDYILSKQYTTRQFTLINHCYGQDERRFNKLGYIGMIKFLITNFLKRNNDAHFIKPMGYWK